MDLVRRIRRDPPGSARAELADFARDPESKRSSDDHSELLVLMAVLCDDASWIELEHGERDAVAVDRASENALRDPQRMRRDELVECAHIRHSETAAIASTMIGTLYGEGP